MVKLKSRHKEIQVFDLPSSVVKAEELISIDHKQPMVLPSGDVGIKVTTNKLAPSLTVLPGEIVEVDTKIVQAPSVQKALKKRRLVQLS